MMPDPVASASATSWRAQPAHGSRGSEVQNTSSKKSFANPSASACGGSCLPVVCLCITHCAETERERERGRERGRGRGIWIHAFTCGVLHIQRLYGHMRTSVPMQVYRICVRVYIICIHVTRTETLSLSRSLPLFLVRDSPQPYLSSTIHTWSRLRQACGSGLGLLIRANSAPTRVQTSSYLHSSPCLLGRTRGTPAIRPTCRLA